jgi:cyclin L
MVASPSTLSQLSNPLVTSSQLRTFYSADTKTSESSRFAAYLLTQAAGILLRLPQPVVVTAIILFQRYLVGYASHLSPDAKQPHSPRQLSTAAIYLAAKASPTPLSPRSVINVYAYLTRPDSSSLFFISPHFDPSGNPPDPQSYYVSEGDYQRSRLILFQHESLLLAGIGFNTHVALPHPLALTYLSALSTNSEQLAKRVFEHLNGALLSPQLLYLTHQPNVLATAAIYLSAMEVGVKLVEGTNWWEVFDVDREALGFCVMAMGSVEGFASAEREKWRDGMIDLG